MSSRDRQKDESQLNKLQEAIYAERSIKRQVAERTQSMRAYARPKKSLLQARQQYSRVKRAQCEQGHFILRTNYITAKRHSCTVASLLDLTEIRLQDMEVNRIHLGCYVKCRVIAEPFYSSGMHLLVQDGHGDVEQVVLYNYEVYEACSLEPKFILPEGTEILVKEPHLQLFGLDVNWDFGVRVDSPTDVIVLVDQSDDSIDSLIERANKEFSQSHLLLAVRLYSSAILKSDQTSLRAYLNRAQCYLKLGKFYLAYEDAKKATQLDPSSEKAFYRMAKAAYQMGQYAEAKQGFARCIELNVSSDAAIELDKTSERIKEMELGEYNWSFLINQILDRRELRLDIADFKSNLIQVADIANKSKGMVACEPIKSGTLLLVSKAATAVFNNKTDSRVKSYDLVQCLERSYNSRHNVEAVTNLIYRMSADPELARRIYSLYAGPEFTRDPLESSTSTEVVIDLRRVEAIFVYNSFQIKSTLDMLELESMEEQLTNMACYDEEVFGELDMNSLQHKSLEYGRLARMQLQYQNLDRQCGLWHMVSYFNHSCLANCHVNFVGDVIAIHTLKDVAKGEELTIRYFPPDWTLTERSERAQTAYGFKCDCDLCQQDESDPMRAARESSLRQIEQTISDEASTSLSECLINLKKVQCTYLKRSEPHLHLLAPLQALADTCEREGKLQDAVGWLEKVYELMKNYNDYMAINTLRSIHKLLMQTNEKQRQKKNEIRAYQYFSRLKFDSQFSERLWQKYFIQ